jgi:hypothetical protein
MHNMFSVQTVDFCRPGIYKIRIHAKEGGGASLQTLCVAGPPPVSLHGHSGIWLLYYWWIPFAIDWGHKNLAPELMDRSKIRYKSLVFVEAELKLLHQVFQYWPLTEWVKNSWFPCNPVHLMRSHERLFNPSCYSFKKQKISMNKIHQTS